MPAPPHASGTATPRKPSSASRATSSAGKRCSSSFFAACGRISLRASSRAVFWMRSCSSLSRKSMAALSPLELGAALLEEGLHALLLVGGVEQRREGVRLGGQGVAERLGLADLHDLLGRRHGEQTLLGD